MSANITILGNLIADPELRFTPNGKALATFTVVSSKSTKNDDGTWNNTDSTFWSVKAWGKTAENVAETIAKGMSVIVVGTAVQEEWNDKTTGEKRSKIGITAWSVGPDLKRHIASVSTSNSYSTASVTNSTDTNPWATQSGFENAVVADTPPF